MPRVQVNKIVCLANSRKLNALCVAGKELKPKGFGDWIRPVSSRENGELTWADVAFQNGQIPQLLDGACLLCSEDEPQRCHRRLVAEYLRDKWQDVSVKITHIT